MSDRGKTYSYEGPITLREGIQMEAGDELELDDGEHLCGAICRRFGLRSDGEWLNVRISIEELG